MMRGGAIRKRGGVGWADVAGAVTWMVRGGRGVGGGARCIDANGDDAREMMVLSQSCAGLGGMKLKVGATVAWQRRRRQGAVDVDP
ncbi:hypothetical protein GCM10012284_13580 [Mangrovihabitans endophyticus]|uniref:Uncharacterized protein n=1 Tax=Mangrovihabitans endophyticus TaxID=1751298 RepID=A0A8J3FN35_9ACTN|nr:hypothetical protein GCM10012284_13580 [Mangrovihabitans endophyticus]